MGCAKPGLLTRIEAQTRPAWSVLPTITIGWVARNSALVRSKAAWMPLPARFANSRTPARVCTLISPA